MFLAYTLPANVIRGDGDKSLVATVTDGHA